MSYNYGSNTSIFSEKSWSFLFKNYYNAGLQNYLVKMLFYDRCTTLNHVYSAIVFLFII